MFTYDTAEFITNVIIYDDAVNNKPTPQRTWQGPSLFRS